MELRPTRGQAIGQALRQPCASFGAAALRASFPERCREVKSGQEIDCHARAWAPIRRGLQNRRDPLEALSGCEEAAFTLKARAAGVCPRPHWKPPPIRQNAQGRRARIAAEPVRAAAPTILQPELASISYPKAVAPILGIERPAPQAATTSDCDSERAAADLDDERCRLPGAHPFARAHDESTLAPASAHSRSNKFTISAVEAIARGAAPVSFRGSVCRAARPAAQNRVEYIAPEPIWRSADWRRESFPDAYRYW